MAYETEYKQSVGERISQIGSAVGGAMKGISDWQERRKQTEMQQKQLELHMQQVAQQMQQAQADAKYKSNLQQGDLLFRAATSASPKDSAGLLWNRYQMFNQYTNGAQDPKQFADQAEQLNKVVGPQMQALLDAQSSVKNIQLDPQTVAEKYRKGKEALMQIDPYVSPDVKASHLDALDQGFSEYNKYRTALEATRIKAENKTPLPNQFNKTFDIESAKGFQKQVEQLPEMQNRLESVDRSLGLVDKILTGPVSGRNIPFEAQKISSEAAQEMEFFLSQENMKALAAQAQAAGVRSMDTEPERQAFLASRPNVKQAPAVLKQSLARVKSIIQQTYDVTREKQQYVQDHGNLQGFVPAQVSGKKAASPVKQLSTEDQQALDWANKNSKDPRAAEIKKRLGM